MSDVKRVLITGWTGNTGGLILERAARRWPDAEFVGITRSVAAAPPEPLKARFSVAVAALEDEAAVERAAFSAKAQPYDLMLHIAHMHHTPVMMRLAERYNVPRALLVHTTGMYSRYREYGGRYREIDDAVRAKGEGTLPCWTIIRPTMIYGNYGSRRDHNMHKLILALSRLTGFPVFGDGSSTFQPVHVEDVADAAMASLENTVCRYRAYDISGATIATYREILEKIARLLGKRRLLVPVPFPVAMAAVKLGERLRPGGVGVNVEQVRRLQESKAYSHADATRDFGFQPRTLDEGLAQEVAQMADAGLLPDSVKRSLPVRQVGTA